MMASNSTLKSVRMYFAYFMTDVASFDCLVLVFCNLFELMIFVVFFFVFVIYSIDF